MLIQGFISIWNSIISDLSILWMIIPIFVTWLVMILYFGKFKSESPSWRGFLQNTLALVWITFGALRAIFSSTTINFLWFRFSILLFILLYSIILFYFSYNHKGPFWLGYFAMPTPINFFAIVAIIGSSPYLTINFGVLFSFLIIFLTMLFISFIVRNFLQNSEIY